MSTTRGNYDAMFSEPDAATIVGADGEVRAGVGRDAGDGGDWMQQRCATCRTQFRVARRDAHWKVYCGPCYRAHQLAEAAVDDRAQQKATAEAIARKLNPPPKKEEVNDTCRKTRGEKGSPRVG